MNIEYEVYTSDLKNDPIIDTILRNLDSFNYSKVHRDIKPFIVALKQADKLLGGAECISIWDWMHVKLMWVNESDRKKGYGIKINDLIEQEALKRKCVGIHLDTFSFQAKDFYCKLGYKIFGVIENHPKGHNRYYLKKIL